MNVNIKRVRQDSCPAAVNRSTCETIGLKLFVQRHTADIFHAEVDAPLIGDRIIRTSTIDVRRAQRCLARYHFESAKVTVSLRADFRLCDRFSVLAEMIVVLPLSGSHRIDFDALKIVRGTQRLQCIVGDVQYDLRFSHAFAVQIRRNEHLRSINASWPTEIQFVVLSNHFLSKSTGAEKGERQYGTQHQIVFHGSPPCHRKRWSGRNIQ